MTETIQLYDTPNAGTTATRKRSSAQILRDFHSLAANRYGIKLLDTVWKDMIMDLFGRRLDSTAGTVDYNYDENCLTFSPGGLITNSNDRVGGNQEINHEFVIGEITLHPHLHWWQPAAESYEFTMRYRVQRNGQPKTTDWTTRSVTVGAGSDVYSYSSGTINQITSFPAITVTVGYSDTIQFQMTRTDAVLGDVSVYFLDVHGAVDRLGTSEEFSQGDIL